MEAPGNFRLAIVARKDPAYSETFIQQHRDIPGAKVFFYFDGDVPKRLEGKGSLLSTMPWKILIQWAQAKLRGLNRVEYVFLRSLVRNRIDCVLAEYGVTGAASLRVCKRKKVPLVVHFHGFDASRYDVLEKYDEPYRQMFDYAAAIIAVSKEMQRDLANMGCPRGKIIYNPYGPRSEFLALQPEMRSKSLLAVGRFVEKKAPHLTLFAFKKVLESHPDAHLVMVGQGPLLQLSKDLCKELGIERHVSFPGVKTPEEIRELMRDARVFIQHSVKSSDGDKEGTPVSILEAQAAGLPVVSTLHAGIPDVVVDGETGFLVNEKDTEGLAQAIVRLLDDQALAVKLGGQAKRRIEENFTLDAHLKTLADTIAKAFGDPPED